jgi:DNA-directed RNA polymerase subunit RPC12/RpoP
VFRIVRQGRTSEQDERVMSAANDGLRTRRAAEMPSPVVACPRYYSGLRGCGQTFTARRYYAEGRLVQCPHCGLFFRLRAPGVNGGTDRKVVPHV